MAPESNTDHVVLLFRASPLCLTPQLAISQHSGSNST